MSYRRRAGLNQLGPPPRVPTSGPFVSGFQIYKQIEKNLHKWPEYPSCLLPSDHPAVILRFWKNVIKGAQSRRKRTITLPKVTTFPDEDIKMSFTYLAVPYTHPELKVMENRYKAALRVTAHLLQQRHWVFCPIVHNHELAKAYQLPNDFEYWKHYNIAMLSRADSLMILTLDGWKDSVGVQSEAQYASDFDIPIKFVDPFRLPERSAK